MPDNLTVQISADSSKLRADLNLAQAELRKLQRELRKASDAGDTARVAELSTQYERLAAQIRKTNRALSDHNKVIAETKTGIAGLIASARALTSVLAGFGIIQAFRGALEIIDKVQKGIDEINKTAAGTGFTPQGVKTIEEIFGDAGVNIDVTRQALSTFNDAAQESRRKLGDLNSNVEHGVKVFRGMQDAAKTAVQGVNVWRGGQKPVEDTTSAMGRLAKAMKDIGREFDITKWSTQEERFKATAGALTELNKKMPELAAEIGKDIYKRPWAEIAAGIFRVGDAWNKTQEDLTKSGRMPSDEDTQRAEEYRQAWDRVGDSIEAMQKRWTVATHDLNVTLVNTFADFIEWWDGVDQRFRATMKTIGDGFKQGLSELPHAFADLGTAFSEAFTVAWQNIKTAADEFFTWLSEKTNAAWSALKGALSAPGGVLPAPGLASGGMVHGPGSGTSDSIMARLSNGEFVMRAAAVRAWGPQLLASMNALGRPLRGIGDGKAFASGGMVRATTGDGAIVNLHFPGGSFSLRGDKSIVQGLTREARRASLLAGGRLPGAAVV